MRCIGKSEDKEVKSIMEIRTKSSFLGETDKHRVEHIKEKDKKIKNETER